MLSIIVCSRTNSVSDSFSTNILQTVGVDYELICIDNSKNELSISQAYSLGILKSKYKYLCFVHEDVSFHTQDWGERIIAHLQTPNAGLIGLAGGDVAFRLLYDYGALNRSVNIIHEDKKGIEPTEYVLLPKNYNKVTRSVVLLDGVLLCAKREIFSKIHFDDKIGKFHGYDYDISIQSIVAGYYNYVMYDVSLTHYSKGKFDATFYKSIINICEKWKKFFPILEHNISDVGQTHLLQALENKSLRKLLKKLIRADIPVRDIIDIFTYYSRVIGSRIDIILLPMLWVRIYLIKITNRLRNKKN